MVDKERPVGRNEREGSLASEIGTNSGTSSSLANSTKMKILLEKGDSEQMIQMAEALLANGLVSAIERVTYQCVKVQKSDDEVAKAVIEVVGSFGVCTQWTAVYRVLVDFCGWDDDIAKFSKRMNRLLKDVRISHKCTYQSIQKPLAQNSILRKNYQEWKKYRAPLGDRVFARQLIIAEKLLKSLSISS